jgi:hypothetical protein
MNKTILKVCFVAALLMSVSSAYANSTISSSTVIGGGTFSPSNKVTISVTSNSVEYSAQSKHSAGDRLMGTNNTDPKMYWSSSTIGSTGASPANTTVSYTSWTSL